MGKAFLIRQRLCLRLLLLILTDSAREGMVVDEVPGLEACKQKNAGLVTVTLNLRPQPRLPGSVVGDASMPSGFTTGKIT